LPPIGIATPPPPAKTQHPTPSDSRISQQFSQSTVNAAAVERGLACRTLPTREHTQERI
jgi:hypothetical protein